MGGSFGAGNIKETLEDLIAIDRDFQILVITGRNEHLKDKLSKMLDSTIHNKNICLFWESETNDTKRKKSRISKFFFRLFNNYIK